MPIQFTCPHCGLKTSVSDDYAGQSGPCAGCGQTITIPVTGSPLAYVPPPRPKKSSSTAIVLVVIAAFLLCSGVPIALLLPAVQAAREAARRAQCSNNLKQLALAMHNYHDVFGSFPPAYIPDEDGRPMHSWRVLILPYIEQSPLYDQYNFDEPWDSPANRSLAYNMPSVYRCPSDPSGDMETSYVMIVGPGTISDGPSAVSIRDVLDGTSNTIMFVEAVDSRINWMEPRDLDGRQISYQINGRGQGEIESHHPGGINVAFTDAAVQFLDESSSPQEMEDLTTIAGDLAGLTPAQEEVLKY